MNSDKLEKILTTILLDNPSATHIVKSDRQRVARIRHLARYMLRKAKRKKGLFISDDGNGLAICYKVNVGDKKTFIDFIEEIGIAFKVIGYMRIPGILKRQAYLKKQLPTDKPYYYFWFFGVNPEKRGAENGSASELKQKVFDAAKNDGLPIYTETSIKKNKVVYQRYGFEIFHEWKMNERSTMWFMKKEF
ncbi:MAG: hypothetical protein HRT68_00785 [Flavobacteriaceae bacterium]|nr:hypothetical protein [Flavobacteriaceae bacterium]